MLFRSESVRPARGDHHHDGADDDAEPLATATAPATDRSDQLTGRNRQGRLVHLPGDPTLVGRRVAVTIERAGPYALVGRLAG